MESWTLTVPSNQRTRGFEKMITVNWCVNVRWSLGEEFTISYDETSICNIKRIEYQYSLGKKLRSWSSFSYAWMYVYIYIFIYLYVVYVYIYLYVFLFIYMLYMYLYIYRYSCGMILKIDDTNLRISHFIGLWDRLLLNLFVRCTI